MRRCPGRRHPAANDAVAIIGLESINARGLIRQPLPDREQQPAYHVQCRGLESGQPGQLGFPCRAEHRAIRRLSMTCLPRFGLGNGIAEWPDKAPADMERYLSVCATGCPARCACAVRLQLTQRSVVRTVANEGVS